MNLQVIILGLLTSTVASFSTSVQSQFNGSFTLTKDIISRWFPAASNRFHTSDINFSFSNRNITDLADGLFSRDNWNEISERIKRIDLSWNQLTQLDTNQFEAFVFLEKLNLSYNQISSIDSLAFKYLRSLQLVDLSHNRLAFISKDTLEHLRYVMYLNFSYNVLTEMPKFRSKAGQVFLDISYNQIEEVDREVFYGLSRNAYLNLSYNRVRSLDYYSANRMCLKDLQMTGNPVANEMTVAYQSNWYRCVIVNPSNPVAENNLTVQLLKDLGLYENRSHIRLLDLSSQKIASAESSVFDGYNRLNYLHLENNSIMRLYNNYNYRFIDSLRYSLLELYLDHNYLESALGLLNLARLQVLSLAYNGIISVDSSSFDGLRDLVWLSLRGNRLTYINYFTFKNQINLRHLDLSDNAITVLDAADFKGLGALAFLDVSDNSINRLDPEMFGHMSMSLVRLDLSVNRIASMISVAPLNAMCLQELKIEDNLFEDLAFGWNETTSCMVLRERSTNVTLRVTTWTTAAYTWRSTTRWAWTTTNNPWATYSWRTFSWTTETTTTTTTTSTTTTTTTTKTTTKPRKIVSSGLIMFLVTAASVLTLFVIVMIALSRRNQLTESRHLEPAASSVI